MKAERLRQRYVRAMQQKRSILAALLIPLSGCGADNEVELAANGIGTNEAAATDYVFWATETPFEHRNCEEFKTEVDRDVPTNCPKNKFVVGISMGWGHSSDFNRPHAIRCCELYSRKYGWILEGTPGFGGTYETRVDNDEMTYCSRSNGSWGWISGQMMAGLTGGWGHSSKYNVPHQFSCDGLIRSSDWFVYAGKQTILTPPVDSDRMVVCPKGGGIIGISGGWGHSSKHNVPHKIACSTDMLLCSV